MKEIEISVREFDQRQYESAVSEWGGKAVSVAIQNAIEIPTMPYDMIGYIEIDEENNIHAIPQSSFSAIDPSKPFLLRLSSPGDHYHFEGVFPTAGMANPPFDAAGVINDFGMMLENLYGDYYLSVVDLRDYCEDRHIEFPRRLQVIAHQYHENIGRGVMMRENDGSILINVDDGIESIDKTSV